MHENDYKFNFFIRILRELSGKIIIPENFGYNRNEQQGGGVLGRPN